MVEGDAGAVKPAPPSDVDSRRGVRHNADMRHTTLGLSGILLVSWALWGCAPVRSAPTATPRPVVVSPAATTPTLAPVSLSPVTATPPALVASTPTPPPVQPAPTLGLAPSATPAPACVNAARFVRDVTIPDDTQLLGGQPFTKRWLVVNTGTCTWGPEYRLAFVDGDPLGAPREVALYPARPGREALLEVEMRAPFAVGSYTSRWEARDPQGNLFGAFVYVRINVVPAP